MKKEYKKDKTKSIIIIVAVIIILLLLLGGCCKFINKGNNPKPEESSAITDTSNTTADDSLNNHDEPIYKEKNDSKAHLTTKNNDLISYTTHTKTMNIKTQLNTQSQLIQDTINNEVIAVTTVAENKEPVSTNPITVDNIKESNSKENTTKKENTSSSTDTSNNLSQNNPVTKEVTNISLDRNEVILVVEEDTILASTLLPSDATNQEVSYTSSDESIATVDNTGKITAIKKGAITITATTHNGKTDTCVVTVKNKPTVGKAIFYTCTHSGNTHTNTCSTKELSWSELIQNVDRSSLKYNGDLATTHFISDNAINDGYSENTSAFSNTKLKSIVIDSNVTYIGNYAFSNCLSLESVTITEGVTTIGKYAFNECKALQSIIVGNDVTTIKSFAFRGCESLSNVQIGSGLSSIDGSVFYKCDALASLTIDSNNTHYQIVNGVVYSKDMAKLVLYPYSKSLVGYQIPNTIKHIGGYVFYMRTGFKTNQLPSNLETIGECAFYGAGIIGEMTLPESLAAIGEYAFYNNVTLSKVVITGNVEEIAKGTFKACTTLNEVRIKEGVKVIGEDAFSGCSSLNNIFIPSSLTTIKEHAFYNCIHLNNIFYASNVQAWESIVKGEGWKTYANNVLISYDQ